MVTGIHIIRPDAEDDFIERSTHPKSDELRDIVEGDIERVQVLWQRKWPVIMFVNETGAIANPLLINDRATGIYHNASRSRGVPLAGAPSIHGVAVLIEGLDYPGDEHLAAKPVPGLPDLSYTE